MDWPWELADGQLKRIEPIWKKWLEFEPVTMIFPLRENLLRLRAMKFDAATGGNIGPAQAFHKALTNASIPHVFEEFPGGHFDRTAERIETKILPFFSDMLAFEMIGEETAVQPHSKLATTWGKMK